MDLKACHLFELTLLEFSATVFVLLQAHRSVFVQHKEKFIPWMRNAHQNYARFYELYKMNLNAFGANLLNVLL